jgi:uncharacterized membrane protein SpoIIM required for sporulation
LNAHQFEARHAADWAELARGLDALDAGARASASASADGDAAPTPERLARLYRLACEHLALARERSYPLHLEAQLEALAARAHQHIYRRHDYGLAALGTLVLHRIPASVRHLRWHVLVAACVFAIPLLAVGLATWADPQFLLRVTDVRELRSFERMYGPDALEHLGRTAGDDWSMFGFYVRHNIGIAFQCFASGITFGIGTLYYLAFNGLEGGAVAGYLTAHGDGARFYPFVVTHSAFELTAIVLSGAAGLRLGHALLAPGRRTRTDALRVAAGETAPVLYGVFMLLVIAAAFEAFWSSAGWIEPAVKYGVGAACWALVLAYLALQGDR